MAYPYIPTGYHGGAQSAVSRIVIHGTVSPTVKGGARAVARYFQSPSAGGSAHYVVDPGEIVQCVKEGTVAYHAPPNTGSIGIELCDPQKGSAARWSDTDHEAMLQLAAKLTREIAARWKIPLKWLTVADLKAGKRGICGHMDVAEAWHQTDHGDPGSGFPWTHFMNLVNQEDDMPEPKDLWNWDGIAAPPWVAEQGNQNWTPASYLHWQYRNLANANAKLDAILKASGQKVDVDESAIVTGVLAGLTPAAIATAVADALPADMAKQVVDELTTRLEA